MTVGSIGRCVVNVLGLSIIFGASTLIGAADSADVAAGGATTVYETNRRAFSLPAANMPMDRRTRFAVGHAFFNQPWVEAPSSTKARDGLGPQFIARSCTGCHTHDGRAAPPEPDEQPMGLLFRLSVPGVGAHGAPLAEPTYGGLFTNQAVDGTRTEGRIVIRYTETPGAFPDGERYSLRQPQYAFTDLGYGPMAQNTMVSPRIAQQLIGLGLLEAIPESALLKRADPADRDGDGISGRPNRVWDAVERKTALGRFGWKANAASVAHQTAAAFNSDIGITSHIFPHEECTPVQKDCRAAERGGNPEIARHNLDSVIFYMRTLAVPARRHMNDPQVQRGEQVFVRTGCGSCHITTWETGKFTGVPEVSQQRIHPYTDLLLHDMGEALADQRPDFLADGREWRTPPLWGIGLVPIVNGHSFYLHDGRARSLTEAVLWHDGEARAAKERFVQLPRADRAALIAFLNSL